MSPKKQAYQAQASTIIKQLNKRNMSGIYFDSSLDAMNYVLEQLKDNATVTWGGSMTLSEIGLLKALKSKPLTLLDRSLSTSKEDTDRIYREAFSADYYLTSTNAITMDGKLINIDGNGNRVAAMIFGPEKVFVIAGMNKVVLDEASGIDRVHNMAAPPNTKRLNQQTPCNKTGFCHDCLGDDCICCQTVITRKSRLPNRIHVILVGEELGY